MTNQRLSKPLIFLGARGYAGQINTTVSNSQHYCHFRGHVKESNDFLNVCFVLPDISDRFVEQFRNLRGLFPPVLNAVRPWLSDRELWHFAVESADSCSSNLQLLSTRISMNRQWAFLFCNQRKNFSHTFNWAAAKLLYKTAALVIISFWSLISSSSREVKLLIPLKIFNGLKKFKRQWKFMNLLLVNFNRLRKFSTAEIIISAFFSSWAKIGQKNRTAFRSQN